MDSLIEIIILNAPSLLGLVLLAYFRERDMSWIRQELSDCIDELEKKNHEIEQ